MAIKNVVVVVDDFTDATFALWEEQYGLELWDYGTYDYEAQLVDDDGYAYGPILDTGSITTYDPLYLFSLMEQYRDGTNLVEIHLMTSQTATSS